MAIKLYCPPISQYRNGLALCLVPVYVQLCSLLGQILLSQDELYTIQGAQRIPRYTLLVIKALYLNCHMWTRFDIYPHFPLFVLSYFIGLYIAVVYRLRMKGEKRCWSICKIWGFHGGDYEEYRLLGYKNPVRTSQETHYVSTTEFSQLMLCKIWGFHDGDYEECRLLGYKNPVRTSQEIHYVSATESSRLILYKIWSFHGDVYEEWRLRGCYAMCSCKNRRFGRT
jgi:hypothetical protein